MRPVSAAFIRAVSGSHRMVADARIVTPGLTGVNPAGTDIPILSGDVTLDGSADSRSVLTMTTEGRGMWPTRASDLLTPYGAEVFVRRGIAFGNGTVEWVSLGYHRLDTPEQDDAPDGPIRLVARDRMAGIVDGDLTAPVAFPASSSYGQVVEQLVTDVYPWAVIEWDDGDTQPIGRQVICEQDRYGFLDDLITSLGKTWHWDHRGILVIRSLPDPTAPVATVASGEGGVLVSLSRRLTRIGVHNGIVATGQGADTATPVRAVAVDLNPDSPTYWHGSFGKVPRFYSSPLITSPSQAQDAAAAMLRQALGLPYAVDFAAVPNPALEPGDVIRVRYPGRSELHVIDRLSISLTSQAGMTASTREQTRVLIGRA